MVRVDAHQVGEVGLEPIPEIELRAVRMLLDEHGVAVARLREAVEFVLGARGFAGFEHQPHLGAFERRRAEIGPGAGDGEPEALAGRQDAVAQVEPQRLRLARLHAET